MEELLENEMFPCSPCTEQVFMELMMRVSFGASIPNWFNAVTAKIQEEQISWSTLRTLYVVGRSNVFRNRKLEEKGIEPGVYTNYCGSWLVLIHPKDTEIQTYVDRCGELLKAFVLVNSKVASLSVSSLTALEKLDIRYCGRLSTVGGLEWLRYLKELSLAFCGGIKELPAGIRVAGSLRKLVVRGMRLRTLPDWLPEIAEGFSRNRETDKTGTHKALVCLSCTVEDIPDMSIFEQPFEMVVRWFEERRLGRTHPLNEIKVVFLGDGEAGKSHTIARLMNDGGDPVGYVDVSTPGIVISHRDYLLGGREVRVHYWDFGGQEIMHSMHRIFLTGRTMYVVLLNARDDAQGDRARYWLRNIKSFAPDAPVLLVLNKIDQNENASVDERDLRARYRNLTQIVRLSAREFTRERFNREFTDKLLEEIDKTGFLDAQWPTAWTEVKKRLENMSGPYISGDVYEDICAECRVHDNQKNLLHWFNDLGISFCWCDEEDFVLDEYVILKPDWITNALYIILFNPLQGARNGRIPHKDIYDILRRAGKDPAVRCTMPTARYTNGDIQYVLGVLRKFNLSFLDGSKHEFIPMLCQRNSTVDIQALRRDENTLEFNMVFDYLPNNLLHRLMVERNGELDLENVWRTGAGFHKKELGLTAVVVIDENTLRFLIRHSDSMHRPNTYLTMLKSDVDRIVENMGLKAPKCQLIYKINGKRAVFSYDRLLKMHQRGNEEEYCEDLEEDFLIVDILNQSAPDRLQDEMRLLDCIRSACQSIQADIIYHLEPGGNGRRMEDQRNRRIRDDLVRMGFHVSDQSQRGISGSGRSVGELDLLMFDDCGNPWTIIEALRVRDGGKSEWNAHLNKLIGNYNYFGARFLYLLTYVDANEAEFARIWAGYQEHIKSYHPGLYQYAVGSFADLNDERSPAFIKAAKCRYSCGGDPVTVYHIFARIPTKNR